MLQSMGSQRVGHDLETEQQRLREHLWLGQGPRNCLNCPEVVLGYGVIDSRTELIFYSAILADESINNTRLQAYFNLFLPNSL